MVDKRLKKGNYSKLVIFIYSLSNYDKKKAMVLYNYSCYHLLRQDYSDFYTTKLALDLNLANEEEVILFDGKTQSYKENLLKLTEMFSTREMMELKTKIWTFLEKGYYIKT